MIRSHRSAGLCLFLLGLMIASALPCRSQDLEPTLRIKPGLGFEYLSRTIVWDDNQYSSSLVSGYAALNVTFEYQKRLALSAFAGYGLSNTNGLIFRQLPFSIDYEAGSVGGLFLGAAVTYSAPAAGFFEIGATGEIITHLGNSKIFDIPELNQAGELTGKTNWIRVRIGPLLRYAAYENATSYLAISFDSLWGTCSMTETVQDLSGTEDKKIKSKGTMSATLGFSFLPTQKLELKAEGTAVPYKKLGDGSWSVDFSAALKAVLSF
jgi:hypothetical protein